MYGWKKAPVEYQSIIDAVVNKLDKEIRILGHDEI